ncbi:MAG: XRE family transcriptional regulator [Lachnospiraceae bacterium]|nr:XRE family transcriptional regulator [Lachnospiraceae bacterium]
MGKRSIRENKNIYQISRENMELTREKASDLMVFLSADRIEKIESEKSLPHADEILAMAEAYKAPALCNYFCSHECPIGKKDVPELRLKDLSQIVLEIISSLNHFDKEKDKLINISVDGEITEEEYEEFATIEKHLDDISLAVRSLRLWVDQTIANGHIDKDQLEEAREHVQN